MKDIGKWLTDPKFLVGLAVGVGLFMLFGSQLQSLIRPPAPPAKVPAGGANP